MKLVLRLTRLAGPVVAAAIAFGANESKAHALGGIDLEAGLRAGVGTNAGTDSYTKLGFGLGGRAGVGIFGLYVGLSGIHYFGSDDASLTLLGGELGYTIKAIPLLQIRPQIGVGNAHTSFSAIDNSSLGLNDLYLEPGVVVLVPLGLVFVGADANVLILPAHTDDGLHVGGATSLTVHGQIGVRF